MYVGGEGGGWGGLPWVHSRMLCSTLYTPTNHNSLGCEQPSRPRCRTITQCMHRHTQCVHVLVVYTSFTCYSHSASVQQYSSSSDGEQCQSPCAAPRGLCGAGGQRDGDGSRGRSTSTGTGLTGQPGECETTGQITAI